MQSLRLASNLRLFMTRQSKCMVRSIYTNQINYESETSKLIRLRKEREAKTEQTTGFDKMVTFNEYHLKILKRHDNKDINRKRDLNIIRMLVNMGVFVALSAILLAVVFHFTCMLAYVNVWKVDKGYWID